MKAWVVAGAALLMAPAAHGQLLSPREIINTLPGRWVMEKAPDKPGGKPNIDCNGESVIRIRIISDEKTLTYISNPETNPSHEARSAIRANSRNDDIDQPGAIVLQYDGEKRLDAKDKPVVWHLLMTDPNTFYWHREDWPNGGTTAPSHRCPDPNLVG